jgi:uncharacterized protein
MSKSATHHEKSRSLPENWISIVLIGLWLVFLGASECGAAERRVVKSLLEMRRENVVVQNYDLSCGAAALATLLVYQHGDQVTEKEITDQLIRDPKYGSSFHAYPVNTDTHYI